MKKLLPQLQNVTLWQASLFAVLSILLTWMLTIYAVIEYIDKVGSDISQMGGLTRVALTTLDATVIVFGLGIYLVAGLVCVILLSIQKRLRAAPVVQCIWGLFIFIGLGLAYALR